MAKIGWGELVVILLIALLVLGPEKLPQVGRFLGKTIRSVKKYVHEATQELDEIDDFKEIRSDVEGIQKDLRSMGRNLEKSVTEDAETLEKDIDSAAAEIRTAVEETPADNTAGPEPEPEEPESQDPEESTTQTQEET